MESLPASRKIFLGCVYPGPLLYNNVVYGCPSTSDILLSEPEAEKRGRKGGKGARDRLINHKYITIVYVLYNVRFRKGNSGEGSSLGMIVIFLENGNYRG